VFCHDSQLPPEVSTDELPSRNLVFEFELARAEGRENSLQAVNVQLVSPRRREDRDRGDRDRSGGRRVPYELKSPEEQLASYEPKITFD
jgi:hypothetical protein